MSDVADGKAPGDYHDPCLFFKKTYLMDGLSNLLKRVHIKLTNGQGNAVVQIQTSFAGGKTYSLMTKSYHYLTNSQKIKELLPTGRPLAACRAAIITALMLDPGNEHG